MIPITKKPEDYAPMQRAKECDREQNRKYRRNAMHMSEGQRRKEMRLMYCEIGNFALKVNDRIVIQTMLKEFEPFVRMQEPVSRGIKQSHAKMSKWYDEVRSEYLEAHREDQLNNQEKDQ